MAVTDEQFLHWLRGRNNSRLTMLAEIQFAYESGGSLATGTIYLSDRQYRTGSSDTPANIRYLDVIESSPQFERSIDVRKLGGRGTMSVGSLVLNNMDGRVDSLLNAIIDAREIKFYVGDETWSRSDFRLVNVAVVASVKSNDREMVLELRDKSYLLDDTIVGDTIATGPNTGKPKPILLGQIRNFDISPYLYDTSALKYYLNNFALDANTFRTYLTDVRDAGVSLMSRSLFSFTSATMTANAATDTMTFTNHGLAANDVIWLTNPSGSGSVFAGWSEVSDQQLWVISAGLTANDFRLSLTKGGSAIDITGTTMSGTWTLHRQRFFIDASAATIELSSSPSGRVTVDMTALPAGGVVLFTHPPHAIFKYVLQNYTALAVSEYDSTAIDALATAESNSIYFGTAILDRVNVLDVLDQIAFGSYSWYGWNEAGVLTVGRLDLANLDAATSTDTVDTTDVLGDLACENLPLPWGKVFLETDRNIVVQTDGLASSVTAANRSLWSQPFQYRRGTTDPGTSGYLANWWDYHKSASDSKPLGASITTPSGGDVTFYQTVCNTITSLFKPWTRVYRCKVGIDKYALNPGDCITLTYPRFGLDAGVKVRVMSVKPRFSERECDLVMVRQVTPDYTTASYN